MNESNFDLEQIREQQKALRVYGHLQWIHWLILAASVAFTFAAWDLSKKTLQSQTENRFEREANNVVELMRERLAQYEDALRSGTATVMAYNDNLSGDTWKTYATSLDLAGRYPGVNGIGVIREVDPHNINTFEEIQQSYWPGYKIHPKHAFPVKLPIVYIEPAKPNAAAIGLDVSFEENRRVAALLARDTATPQISGPITLVQDDGKTPGFLFYMPFYTDDKGFGGLVYAALVVKHLVAGVLGTQERLVYFSIQDSQALLYDEISENEKLNTQQSLKTQIDISLYGRQWQFTIAASDAFFSQSGAIQPLIVLISGLIIDAILLLLFLMITRSNNHGIFLADLLIDKLGEQTLTLTQKNAELESFAYVASHDLKTPIRAIHSLSEFIEEDVNDLVPTESTRKAIKTHTRRIKEQTVKSDALVKGLLHFAIVGQTSEAPEKVDVSELVHNIAKSLEIPCQQITFESNMPILDTYNMRLSQIFENLIGNAYKYHANPIDANIEISVEDNNLFYRFYVADNGNGIESAYHDRVFNPFVTLQAEPNATSSGIGLSIVKKSVKALGGEVGIVADYYDGVKFYFDWPKVALPQDTSLNNAA